MAWLVGLILVVAFFVLLLQFPKQTLAVVGLLIGGLFLLIYLLDTRPREIREAREAKVTVTIVPDSAACASEFPLLVSVENRSEKTVQRVDWENVVHRPGFSTPLHSERRTSDKILAPGESWRLCYGFPYRSADMMRTDLLQLSYRVESKNVHFEN